MTSALNVQFQKAKMFPEMFFAVHRDVWVVGWMDQIVKQSYFYSLFCQDKSDRNEVPCARPPKPPSCFCAFVIGVFVVS